jgi:hypothetical protein
MLAASLREPDLERWTRWFGKKSEASNPAEGSSQSCCHYPNQSTTAAITSDAVSSSSPPKKLMSAMIFSGLLQSLHRIAQ